MARRNSRFINQKIIVGNKSIQAEDLTDSALNALAQDSDFVRTVELRIEQLDRPADLVTQAGSFTDAGVLNTTLDAHTSLFNGLDSSILHNSKTFDATTGDGDSWGNKTLHILPSRNHTIDSDYLFVHMDIPESYTTLQNARYDSAFRQDIADGLDSFQAGLNFRKNDYLDSFFLDNINGVYFDSAGNTVPLFRYKLHTPTTALQDYAAFFGIDAGKEGDAIVNIQILDSALSGDAGAIYLRDDSGRYGYYTVLDSIAAPLAETILNREFYIPAAISFDKGSQDSYYSTYSPDSDLFSQLSSSGFGTYQTNATRRDGALAYKVRKLRSAFRFKTAISDGLTAGPTWSRVSPKFRYIIPKPGGGGDEYFRGLVWGKTKGSGGGRVNQFDFASENYTSVGTLATAAATFSTSVYGIEYGNSNSNYFSPNSGSSGSIPYITNSGAPMVGKTFGVMSGGSPGTASTGFTYSSFSTRSVASNPGAGSSPGTGYQGGVGGLTAPNDTGYIYGGGNVSAANNRRTKYNFVSNSWSGATTLPGTSGNFGPAGPGLQDASGFSNSTYGMIHGGHGTYQPPGNTGGYYTAQPAGRYFPFASDATFSNYAIPGGRQNHPHTQSEEYGWIQSGYTGPGGPGGGVPLGSNTPSVARHKFTWATTSWSASPNAPANQVGASRGHWS